MTLAALANHLLRRVEIAQGKMDDCLDWSEPASPVDEKRAEQLKKQRHYESKRRARDKAKAERKAKRSKRRQTGWHKMGRADWKRRSNDARDLSKKK